MGFKGDCGGMKNKIMGCLFLVISIAMMVFVLSIVLVSDRPSSVVAIFAQMFGAFIGIASSYVVWSMGVDKFFED